MTQSVVWGVGREAAFVAMLDRFREKLAWHGLTPESNPSAGNRFRGLYNIALKSLGAVHKKDPRTRLDTVIDYAQPLRDLAEPGFTFMNGPGNDLEGIAGQVGAGCNLILFATGNGSVTNFPFVPTLKFVTTTPRYELLHEEMDVDAGRYLGGGSTVQLEAGTPFFARFFCGCWNLVSRVARWAAGSCVWVEADAFRAAGGFGTEFYAGEEVFLSRRLHRIGEEPQRGQGYVAQHGLHLPSHAQHSQAQSTPAVCRAAQ